MDIDLPGASRIAKGQLPLRVLSEQDVERLLEPNRLLDALADGFRRMERGEVQEPPRPELSLAGGFILCMPAGGATYLPTVKMVSVFEGNLGRGLPNHLALIVLFDPETGAPTCVMDGTFVTGIRTAAAAVLSVDILSRSDSRVATLIGAGVQGRLHLRLLPLVRDLDEILITSRHTEDAEHLASLEPRARPVADVRGAVEGSDIVCLATHSARPVIDARWVAAGTHVTSVGYHPPDGELPRDLLASGRVVVESEAALQDPPVGCAELAGFHEVVTLGAVLEGTAPGRAGPREVTVYKAMGVGMEDMVAANLVHAAAVRDGVGTVATY
jgi:alanine dehydrogenase